MVISLLNPISSHHANSASAISGSFLARHSQNDIRARTVQLSSVRPSFSSSPYARPSTPRVPDSEALVMRNTETGTPAFIFPPPSESVRSLPLEQAHELVETPTSSSINLTESTSTLDPRLSHPHPQSNLSILMARYSSRSPSHERAGDEEGDLRTPVPPSPAPTYQPQQGHEYMPLPTSYPLTSPQLTERTPLLLLPPIQSIHHLPHKWVAHARSIITEGVHALPAVILGLLLNILDGISCTFFVFQCLGLTCIT